MFKASGTMIILKNSRIVLQVAQLLKNVGLIVGYIIVKEPYLYRGADINNKFIYGLKGKIVADTNKCASTR